MVRTTTLPAAPARRVQTSGPPAEAARAAAPVSQVRRVNRVPGAPASVGVPCPALSLVIVSSLRVMRLRPASGREGVGGPPEGPLGCLRRLAGGLSRAERSL